jgi:hypothetical protein
VIKRKECFVAIRDIECRKVSDIPEGTQNPLLSKRRERILNKGKFE